MKIVDARIVVKLAALLMCLAVLVGVQAALAAPDTFVAATSGAQEVPGPGDPDGSGTATIDIDTATDEVCWVVTWANIDDPTAAHIHAGAAGVAGPIVVTLDPIAAGCTNDADADAIAGAPEQFYVNVHNEAFPAGAIRGQLEPQAVSVPEFETSLPIVVTLGAVAAYLATRGVSRIRARSMQHARH